MAHGDYGFDYEDVRGHKGVAYFPKVRNDEIIFEKNKNYKETQLVVKEARTYEEFGLKAGVPIYTQYEENKEMFTFVTNPTVADEIWKNYEP